MTRQRVPSHRDARESPGAYSLVSPERAQVLQEPEQTPPPTRLPAPPKTPSLAPGRAGIVVAVVAALGGGAGVSQVVSALRSDGSRELLEEVRLLRGRFDAVDHRLDELQRDVRELQVERQTQEAARRARDELVRSYLDRSQDPAAKRARRALDE